jgi:hypothetical protein
MRFHCSQGVDEDGGKPLGNPPKHISYCTYHLGTLSPHDLAKLGQHATQPVHLHRAEFDQLLPSPVQGQHSLLDFSFDSYGFAGLLYGKPDRPCVGRVILVANVERLYELGR